METIVKDAGFTYYAQCNCNGIYKRKFEKKDTQWKIFLMPRKHQFQILENNSLRGTFFEYQLNQKLSDYGII